jgi:holo-ACP synthase CitX
MKCINWLNSVLENRERRVKKQQELRQKYNSCVLSLSINIPGRYKCTKEAEYIYKTALKEIENFDFKVYEKFYTNKETGYEALFAMEVEPHFLKIFTCKIEEEHPLGRFMDIDVIKKDGSIVSRNNPRKCYICDDNAKVCARIQKHKIQELLDFISKQVDDYKTSL